MEIGLCNVLFIDDNALFVIVGKTSNSKETFGTVTIDGDDAVVSIHLHIKRSDKTTINDKLKYLYEWIVDNGYHQTENTEIGVRLRKRNKETHVFEKCLIPINEFREK